MPRSFVPKRDAPIPANPITPEEIAAPRLIADEPARRDVDHRIRDRLLLLGYVRVALGGLAVTNEGFLRLVIAYLY
jgi:hypothetical protein